LSYRLYGFVTQPFKVDLRMEEMKVETVNSAEKVNSSFLEEVSKKSGENLSLCYQCLKCTAGCPTAPNMDIRPNNIIRMIQMGMKKEVLGSGAIWFCVYCQTCGTRCPNEIHIGVLMDALREMAMEEGIPAKEKNIHLFHEAFIQSVRRGGRAHEITMLMDYMLRSRDLMKGSLLPGVKLFLKGKFPLLPSFIKGRDEIKRIFEKCEKK